MIVQLMNVIMTMAFMVSVLVQYNDPDALLWIAIYGLAATACIAFSTRRLQWWQAAVLAAVSLVWATALVPSFWGQITTAELFGSVTMKTLAVERARECGGLLIVFAWMAVLAIRLNRTSARPPAAPSGVRK